MKEKLLIFLSLKNTYDKYYSVSLIKARSLPFFTFLKVWSFSFVLVVVISGLAFENNAFLMFILFLFVSIFIYFCYRKIRDLKLGGRPIEKELKRFIFANKFYALNSEKDIIDELDLGYVESANLVSVFALKNGGAYHDIAENISDKLQSALGMPLFKKVSSIDKVEYIFRKSLPERIIYNMLPLFSQKMVLDFYDNIFLDLHKNFSMIISGASGGGKSHLLYGLIGQFASKYIEKDINGHSVTVNAKLYLIDPKMSDIYKHAELANFPTDQYASDIKGAFRLIRIVSDELERRKNIYSQIEKFDTTMLDLGHEPILLVIDEYSSLVAQMAKKEKEDFERLIGNIARLGRQLSIGIWIVMQQASADGSAGLPTGIREQLVNKVFMGNPSAQSAQMVFGVGLADLPKVSQVGEGILSIDGGAPVAFLAPSFAKDVNEVVQPVLKSASDNYHDMIEIEELFEISD